MLAALRKRLHNDEDGFTLIELMVVVLIIAILIAIAIPTFLGAKDRAHHRSAQSNLRNGLTAEKSLYSDGSKFSADAAVALPGVEPSLGWTNADPPATGTNAVEAQVTADGQTVCLSAVAA